jgi:hypothetical protein
MRWAQPWYAASCAAAEQAGRRGGGGEARARARARAPGSGCVVVPAASVDRRSARAVVRQLRPTSDCCGRPRVRGVPAVPRLGAPSPRRFAAIPAARRAGSPRQGERLFPARPHPIASTSSPSNRHGPARTALPHGGRPVPSRAPCTARRPPLPPPQCLVRSPGRGLVLLGRAAAAKGPRPELRSHRPQQAEAAGQEGASGQQVARTQRQHPRMG